MSEIIMPTRLPRRAAPAGSRTPADPTPPLDGWWSDGAGRAIDVLAARGRPFGADELFDEPFALPAPPHPSQVGAAFRGALARGVVRPVGFRESTRTSRRGGVQRLWIGVVGVGDAA